MSQITVRDSLTPAASAWRLTPDNLVRVAVTAALAIAYFAGRTPAIEWLHAEAERLSGDEVRRATVGVLLLAGLMGVLLAVWWQTLKKDKRFHAPILITCVLLLGEAAFSFLENHSSRLLAWLTAGTLTQYSPTVVAILTTTLTELVLGRFFYGKWPHVASAYVSGISAGILIKSPVLWPFVLCGTISITSKYVLRIGERHLWNPTNLGVTLMLFLAPSAVASLNVQAGNEVWAVLVIWVLGGLILWQLRLLHITVAFVLTFLLLSPLRAWHSGNRWLVEVAPITSPMFQLFIFFMITDPKTITRARWSQVLVAVLVGVADAVYRVAFRDDYSLYHSLFTVGPIANLIEIGYLRWQREVPSGVVLPAAAAD